MCNATACFITNKPLNCFETFSPFQAIHTSTYDETEFQKSQRSPIIDTLRCVKNDVMKMRYTCSFFANVLFAALFLSKGALALQSLSQSEALASDTQQRMAQHDIVMLLAGTEQVPVKVAEAHVPLTRGVAIIVTEQQHGLYGQQGLSAVATSLNDWGWYTVVLPAPKISLSSDAQRNALPEANATTAQLSLSEESLTRYSLALSQRIEAVYAQVQTTPGYRLIVSQGVSSAGLIRLFQQGTVAAPDGLVTAAPFWPDSELNGVLPEQLANTVFPVLDLTSEWDNRWSIATAQERAIKATTGLKIHYRQRDIIGTDYNAVQYHAVAKEIYGWLTFLGW